MFKIAIQDNRVQAETGGGAIVFDARRGGQIAAFNVKTPAGSRPLIPEGALWPDLSFHSSRGAPHPLANRPARLAVLANTPEYARFAMSAPIRELGLEVTLQYAVYPEGALFCDLQITATAAPQTGFVRVAMDFPVALRQIRRARWGYFSREMICQKDPFCIHAFPATRFFQPLGTGFAGKQLLPLVALDLGWPPAELFSNRVEFLIEDWIGIDEAVPGRYTRTRIGSNQKQWSLAWRLYDGPPLQTRRGFQYRNRWGIIFGCARSSAGKDAEPAQRNNVLGARIAHCNYPYARAGENWPWCVMPSTQSAHMPPRYFRGLPELETADRAAAGGANLMVLHQFWMRNPGSNCEPPADYQPLDPKWLKAFISRCHRNNMRVGLYMRGVEMFAMYSDFFERFLEPDRDGLYVDWSQPLAPGWAKCSSLHFSAYNYFRFTRALRKRVGPGGFLIAHNANVLAACAPYDACLSGEAQHQKTALLTGAEACAYFSMLGGCGAHLIWGDAHSRKDFATRRATAFCAGLGLMPHAPLMPPGRSLKKEWRYLRPFWDLLIRLGGRPVRLLRSATGDSPAETESPEVYCATYQAAGGRAALFAANLGEQARDVRIVVDAGKLGLPGNIRLKPFAADMARAARAKGCEISIRKLMPFGYCGVMIDRP